MTAVDAQALAETLRAAARTLSNAWPYSPLARAAEADLDAALDGLVEALGQRDEALSESLDVLVERWHQSGEDWESLHRWMELGEAEYARFAEEGPSGYVAVIAARAAPPVPVRGDEQ